MTQQEKDPKEGPADRSEPSPDLAQPKTDQERMRVKDSGLSQPEEPVVEENLRRGEPRHRN